MKITFKAHHLCDNEEGKTIVLHSQHEHIKGHIQLIADDKHRELFEQFKIHGSYNVTLECTPELKAVKNGE
jgi:hypothetical protein